MKTKEQIIEEAKDSYTSHFKDAEEKPEAKSQDVVIDKVQMEQEIEAMKAQEKSQHESLEVLKEKLTEEAEDSLKKTFGEEQQSATHEKLNTQEMYEKLNEEKEHLTKIANQLKEQELKKKKHEQ